jgi:4-coumarate--CoA ligase
MTPIFTMESMLSAIETHRPSELLLVPPILLRMVRDPIVDKYDLSSVTRLSSGAAPLSVELIEQLAQKFPRTAAKAAPGQAGLKQGYGMTESCSCITAFPLHRVVGYKYGNSVGEIVSNTEVKIIMEDGKEGGIGDEGEIWARGPQITMGYLGNEKATRETFDADGYLHTGDWGVVDADGMIWILDRIKGEHLHAESGRYADFVDMVKVKGHQVAPAELEDLLLGHDLVEDCAVIGIPDDWSGEVPKAFVVPKPGVSKDRRVARAIMRFVQENKIRYKWLKEVELVNEIPKSASGKILKKNLRNRDPKAPKGVILRRVEKSRL